MKIIQPSFQILRPANLEEGIAQLRFIESMARISHMSQDKQSEESWRRFIQFVVMEKGDFSVIEHASATVLITTDRGISHELVRHRLFSYTQQSTRFVRYGDKHEMEFIEPSGVSSQLFHQVCQAAENNYMTLLAQGYKPQEARSVLPNALAAKIAVTGNLRSWHHLLNIRTTKETHEDFKRITIPLLQEFKNRIPILFDMIAPESKQSDYCKG